jgi:hypothetical protein
VREAADVRDHPLAQLRNAGEVGEVQAEADRLVEELGAARPWRAAAALTAAADRIRQRYVEIRRGLLATQGTEAEAAQSRVKIRSGFERLSPDETQRVLRPIKEAIQDTSPEAVAPTLVELRDRFPRRLAEGEERANDTLDDLLSRAASVTTTKKRAPIVKVETRLAGREIESPEQLDAALAEVRERVVAQLDRGARVRLV